MKFFQKLIKKNLNQEGVALFIVLASMATLAIFVGEITYTSQINQKLAYDRLDQVKALSLAKSGLRIALLRIRAYSELKKLVGKASAQTGASADAISSMLPKNVMEKIWAEPITIPFSGDISGLPTELKDAVGKFRKESGMEGKLYISIQAQSNKVNLNSTLPQFAAVSSPSPSATPKRGQGGTANPDPANPSPTPPTYDATQSRQGLTAQIQEMFQRRFETDQRFRDQYQSYRIDDLANEIFGWSDLSYDSPREQMATIPFKKAPFYHVSELHYLPSMDDEVYNMLSEQFSAGIASTININTIKESVLKGIVPAMTKEELKKFYDYRDASGEFAGQQPQLFKTATDFYAYLKKNTQAYGSDTRINEFKDGLTQRGIQIVTEESNFLVHIEATVQQTKRTLEAMVSFTTGTVPSAPTRAEAPPVPTGSTGRSNLKITQMRFL